MLEYGYLTKMKSIKENPYVLMDIEHFIEHSYRPLNWSKSKKSSLYVCYDDEIDKIVCIMEVNKSKQLILAIESRFTGHNYAIKMINHFDKKYKTKIQPTDILEEAEGFWKKYGYI